MLTLNRIFRLILIPVMIIALTACGGGDEEGGSGGSGGSGDSGGSGGSTGYSGSGDSGSSSQVSLPGAATLSWTPPTENVDGTALNGISYYNIYYGTEVGNYTNTVRVDNPGLTEYMIENLPGNNTYYFVVTAVDDLGNESSYSNVASKTLT